MLRWPLRTGLGVQQGMLDAHAATLATSPYPPPATEASFIAPGFAPWREDMVPYVDERGELVELGLEWHAKLLQRIELTSRLVNAYSTQWDASTTLFEAEYWFGGLVTGGIAPQPGWSLAHPPSDAAAAATRRWLQRYARWGRADEGGVHTLVYDATCCHVQGVCEWVACNDSVLATLVGGRAAAANETAPAAGLILGSAAPAVVPPRLFDSSRALLLFQTRSAPVAALTAGASADRRLTLVLTSPLPNATLALSGGFFDLGASPATVWQTVTDADGAQASRRALFGGKPVTGPQRCVFDRAAEAAGLAVGFEVAFEKVGA
jgi:hypothetical protein